MKGETVVSGKRFQEFIRNMPDDTVTITQNENLLTISSGGATVDLLTMTPEDFPTVKIPDADKSFSVKIPTLANLIRKTAFSAGDDQSRPIFTGVNFEIDGENITAVATNTHRLACTKEKLETPCDKCNFTVPAETLKNIATRLTSKNPDDLVSVSLNQRNVAFKFDNVLTTARLLEGIFPPYDRVIPKETFTNISVDTAEFKRVIDFISIIAKESEHNTVKLDVGFNYVDISSNSKEIGNAIQSVEAQKTGNDLEINFNVKYISDAVRVIDSKKLNIGFGEDKFNPAMFTEPDNPDFVYVVTPVRA